MELTLMELIKNISNGLTPLGVLGCIIAIVLKWKQVGQNTICIHKITETLGEMNKRLDTISENTSKTKGWIEGFKNGKNLGGKRGS